MALVLARRCGESITLTLDPDHTQADIDELVTRGIVVTVTNTEPSAVRLAFEAPGSIEILRTELLERG